MFISGSKDGRGWTSASYTVCNRRGEQLFNDENYSIFKMELAVLSALEWRLSIVTPLQYLSYFVPMICLECESPTEPRAFVLEAKRHVLAALTSDFYISHPSLLICHLHIWRWFFIFYFLLFFCVCIVVNLMDQWPSVVAVAATLMTAFVYDLRDTVNIQLRKAWRNQHVVSLFRSSFSQC